MKRKTAKEILADSFHELAEDRQIDKITVREIAANCGYSSATFYRQFRDKYERGCIPLETEELLTLKSLLCKAMTRMHELEHKEKA